MNDSEKIINIKEVKEYLNKQYSYNGAIARTIKIYKVIPRELQPNALNLFFTEGLEIPQEDINSIIKTWENNNKPYIISGEGRSGGYLVLCKELKKNMFSFFTFDKESLDDMEDQDLLDIYKVVKSFNDCVDSIIQHTIHLAKNYKIVEKQVEVTRTVTSYHLEKIKGGENEK